MTDTKLPRVEIKEYQEFSINGNVFIWHFSNEAKTQVIMKGVPQEIEPLSISVTSTEQMQLFDDLGF